MESSDAKPVEQPAAKKTIAEKIGAALPIALTAISTALAGLSTGELQQAMFWRSAAAQDQARATSQWTLAGFKRDRALICETTASQLQATAGYPANPFASNVPNSSNDLAHSWLAGNGPERVNLPPVQNPQLQELLKAIQNRNLEQELLRLAAKVPQSEINSALDQAEEFVETTDKEWDPTLKAANKLTSSYKGNAQLITASKIASYELDQRRYRIESYLNQGVGYLYEARVKISTAESDKHRYKSKNFFYAMLAAQAGAVISSLALARQQKSVLWAVAGCAGLIALIFAAYVYLDL